jgi:hypothetical protein
MCWNHVGYKDTVSYASTKLPDQSYAIEVKHENKIYQQNYCLQIEIHAKNSRLYQIGSKINERTS